MNCVTIQRRLLGSERPDQPSAEVRDHLASCPACQDWQRRLLHLEQQLPLLPVPPSTRRERLVQQILQSSPATPASPTGVDPRRSLQLSGRSSSGSLKERGLQKLALAFALAAALACFAIGWWAWPHQPEVPVDPFQQRVQQLDWRLANKKPLDRIQILADVADQLHDEAQANVNDPERMALVAQFYTEVLRKYLVPSAQELPPQDRRFLADVAQRLDHTESEASRRAAEIRADSVAASDSLRVIAAEAHDGAGRLRDLARG
jgi:hypothetical protein